MITRGLEISEADVYLVDASYSMRGEKWGQINAFPFPKGAKIYTYTTFNYNCDLDLRSLRPIGNTPLWSALYQLLEQIESRQTITVVTDGEDNASKKTSEEAIALAKRKGIHINIVGFDVKRAYLPALQTIAKETGGSIYLETRAEEETPLGRTLLPY